jgi:ElaB/YqjD/DUF883 family membrane-anchored ribosome-binding protein
MRKKTLMRAKGKENLANEYDEYLDNIQQAFRDNKRDTGEQAKACKKKQADYMKQYKAKKKQEKEHAKHTNLASMERTTIKCS